jgi:hypothetical protein
MYSSDQNLPTRSGSAVQAFFRFSPQVIAYSRLENAPVASLSLGIAFAYRKKAGTTKQLAYQE